MVDPGRHRGFCRSCLVLHAEHGNTFVRKQRAKHGAGGSSGLIDTIGVIGGIRTVKQIRNAVAVDVYGESARGISGREGCPRSITAGSVLLRLPAHRRSPQQSRLLHGRSRLWLNDVSGYRAGRAKASRRGTSGRPDPRSHPHQI